MPTRVNNEANSLTGFSEMQGLHCPTQTCREESLENTPVGKASAFKRILVGLSHSTCKCKDRLPVQKAIPGKVAKISCGSQCDKHCLKKAWRPLTLGEMDREVWKFVRPWSVVSWVLDCWISLDNIHRVQIQVMHVTIILTMDVVQ